LRWVRVHGRDPRRPLLPRRQDSRDRRRNQRGTEARYQSRTGTSRRDMKTDNPEWLPAWEDPDVPARPPESAPAGAPAGTPPPGDVPHNKWRRRLLIGGISFVVFAVLAVGAGYVYYCFLFAHIHKANIAGLA